MRIEGRCRQAHQGSIKTVSSSTIVSRWLGWSAKHKWVSRADARDKWIARASDEQLIVNILACKLARRADGSGDRVVPAPPGGRAMRIAVVVASLALAGAVQAQAQTGAWKVGSGTPVTLKGSNPATGEPNSSSLAVGCNLRTGRIYGSVSVIPFSFPNGKAVLTWGEREDVLRTFEGLEGFDYPTILLLTEDLSFLDNIIGHNRLTVSAEVEIEGRRARMESRFDLSGSQAAFRTISCWPPSARPAPSNPPSEALERARQKCRETFSDDFVLQNACIEQQEEAYRNRR